MNQLYWAKVAEHKELSGIPLLKEMQIALLNENFEELDMVVLKFPVLDNPTDREKLSMFLKHFGRHRRYWGCIIVCLIAKICR